MYKLIKTIAIINLTVVFIALIYVNSLVWAKVDEKTQTIAKTAIDDSSALVALYNSTNGPGWKRKDNWLSSNPISTWHGVRVSEGRVNGLYLNNNHLSGSIPPEIGNLTNLESLWLYDNQLNGSMPPEIGDLTNLKDLDLFNNQLNGSIPLQIGDLTNLKRLLLYHNQLSGSIPSEIGNLINLKRLWLHDNQLNGSIPPEIGNLTNLESLWLHDNQLNGSIPPQIGDLKNLEELSLYHNHLSGSIPPQIGDLTNLESLSLYNNQLSGSIPPEIGNLTNLKYLDLRFNQLSGSIPPQIGDLTNLVNLMLRSNQLSGSIPSQIGNLTNLERLTLFHNQLNGTIPPQIGNLTNLEYLDLRLNQLSGTIPPEIKDLKNLEGLRLDNNQLSGSIPPEIGDLINLTGLFLQSNQFTNISDLSHLSMLRFLYIQENRFTFEDIEPNIDVSNFNYSPQTKVGETEDISKAVGSSVTFSVTVGGSANQYQWYKDSVIIAGATTNDYTITGLDDSDAGCYTCKITNTIATALTLESNPKNLTVVEAQEPVLAVNPTTLDFGASLATLQLQISNTGAGTLNWSISESPGKSWINPITPSTGSGSDTLSITVDRSKLRGSRDSGTLVVSSNGGTQNIFLKIRIY